MIASNPISADATRIVLFDVDNTIVEARPGSGGMVNPYLVTLERMLVDAGRAPDLDAAQAMVERQINGDGACDIAEYLPAFGVNERDYLAAATDRLRPSIRALPDAVAALRGLAQRGYRLYPATTNSRSACITKLAAVGLGDDTGSPLFVDLFGGSQLCPEGKTSPDFYRALLRRIDAAADEVVMVGDDAHADLALARAAGITRVVLPRRDQREDCVVEADGGVYVRSLERLLDWLPPRDGADVD
ncbi:MAG: HAD family hydrolase [Phycisphaeraceae bacterium]